MTVHRGALRAAFMTIFAGLALAGPASAAAPPPAVTVRADAVSTSAGTMTVAFHCVARAQQTLAMETYVSCWLSSGSRAQVEQPGVAWATADGVATIPVSPFQICWSTWSRDVLGEKSVVGEGCGSSPGSVVQ